jgi:hypothetical protein
LDEVKLNFRSVARIARSHGEFIRVCASEIASPSRSRIARGQKLAAENTWEAIVAKMEQHITDIFKSAADSAAKQNQTVPARNLTRLAYV